MKLFYILQKGCYKRQKQERERERACLGNVLDWEKINMTKLMHDLASGNKMLLRKGYWWDNWQNWNTDFI